MADSWWAFGVYASVLAAPLSPLVEELSSGAELR
jgi:hypothetical protein